jgi:beta-aspartyl-dipeptidase (metallo-type)
VTAEMLYPTHVERTEALMDEAIGLAKQGSFVDIDTVEGDLAKWVRYYLDHGGDPAKLTVSSDSGASSPMKLYQQICECVVRHRMPIEQVLPLVTANTAKALKLKQKGVLEPGKDADVVVMRRDSLDVVHVFARGQRLFEDGQLTRDEGFIATTNRKIELTGTKK